MLYDSRDLSSCALRATDGDIGRVSDLYFDDDSWTVRYLVVDTGGWLGGRKVLISPMQVRAIEWRAAEITVELTREQVEQSPDYDTEKPVSRQHETDVYGYYGMPSYWTGPYLWGAMAYPAWGGAAIPPISGARATPSKDEFAYRRDAASEKGDPHLRSVDEVSGYHVEATDGSIGHIETLLIDDASWSIRAVVIDTKNWLPGKHVFIPPRWIESVNWDERKVYAGVARDTVRDSPEYEPSQTRSSDYEERIYGYFRERGHAHH